MPGFICLFFGILIYKVPKICKKQYKFLFLQFSFLVQLFQMYWNILQLLKIIMNHISIDQPVLQSSDLHLKRSKNETITIGL